VGTYREAGVDLDAAEAVVRSIGDAVTGTWDDHVVGGFGGFAAGLRLPDGYERPVLMMSTDGVGTKAEVARLAGMLDGIGYDLVAMCIDDLVAAGARPVAMTDYIAVGAIDVSRIDAIVSSIAAACAEADVALLGGETAEHPGVMAADAFDLAGAALGIVEDGAQIDGTAIRAGDAIIGILSPNLRSNGFSLVRRIVPGTAALDEELPGTGRRAAEVLLEPSVLYTPGILRVLETVEVHGMAHVTGGGLPGNLPRVLPPGCAAAIDTDAWIAPPVFAALQHMGNVPGADMYRTFNMGIGFVVVVAPGDSTEVIDALATTGHEAAVIGAVVPGDGAVALHQGAQRTSPG
jgi:phosphoribosylformylglycinamidine cyclo-ligase